MDEPAFVLNSLFTNGYPDPRNLEARIEDRITYLNQLYGRRLGAGYIAAATKIRLEKQGLEEELANIRVRPKSEILTPPA